MTDFNEKCSFLKTQMYVFQKSFLWGRQRAKYIETHFVERRRRFHLQIIFKT